MKHALVAALAAALCAIAAAGAFATANPSGHGQPSQTCLSGNAPMEPGNAANARGSAFNESGPGVAGTVYAGNGANLNTPANAAAVSQYDVACFQVSQSH